MSTALSPLPKGLEWQVPGTILRHRPTQTQRSAIAAETLARARPTDLHPMASIALVAGYAWVLLVCWAVFAGYGYMGFALVIATLITGAIFGLLFIGGFGGRDVSPWQRSWQSFSEFLSNDVEVWGARISGRAAFAQVVTVAWCLALLMTALGIIIEAARP